MALVAVIRSNSLVIRLSAICLTDVLWWMFYRRCIQGHIYFFSTIISAWKRHLYWFAILEMLYRLLLINFWSQVKTWVH